jgi:hypothetical protein
MTDGHTANSPDIEVDEAAAYFGVTQSSDILHAMMAMPREQAMVQFFEVLSDIVLRPGDFDFEAASERMQCEGGEIYYLVAGHLGLMSMPDPLLNALGMPDSAGEVGGASLDSLEAGQRSALEQLADPMRMMKLFAVAYQTGASDEVLNYMSAVEGLLANVSGSVDALISINQELNAALDVAGHVVPIASLASGSAAATTVDIPEAISLPSAPAVVTPSEPEVSVSTPTPVPLPTEEVVVPDVAEPTVVEATPSSVPLPSSAVALPEVSPVVEEEKAVNMESEREVARATQDAFSGAFSSQLIAEPEPEVVEELPVEDIAAPVEEEFVSAAEHFIAADTDGSGALDVEELAQATGTSIEEAAQLHAQADTDGDGVVSLSEFIASPAAEKTASLPKPVAPVRKPLGNPAAQQQAQPQPAPVQQRPQPLPQQPWQQQPQQQPQQQWPQPQQQGWQQPMQPQGWPQPQAPLVQPTIRSGVHCRGCGIGLDPYWRFCPVCGQQNLGY